MQDNDTKGMNPLTMNQQYAKESKKPIRKENSVEEPKYEGLGSVYKEGKEK